MTAKKRKKNAGQAQQKRKLLRWQTLINYPECSKERQDSEKEVLKNTEKSLRRQNIYLIRVRAQEIQRVMQGRSEVIFKKMMSENFPGIINNTKLQIQEIQQRISRRIKK